MSNVLVQAITALKILNKCLIYYRDKEEPIRMTMNEKVEESVTQDTFKVNTVICVLTHRVVFNLYLPQIFNGASSSSNIGCDKNISRDLRHSPLISVSVN